MSTSLGELAKSELSTRAKWRFSKTPSVPALVFLDNAVVVIDGMTLIELPQRLPNLPMMSKRIAHSSNAPSIFLVPDR